MSTNADHAAPPEGRHIRVAVVQLAYHPAARDDSGRSPLEDPLFEPGKADSLLPSGMTVAPAPLQESLEQLRRRIRAAYNEQILERVRAVLARCRDWGVQIVVFPEYCVPHDLLEPIAQAAGDMVVVAGTHTFDREVRASKVYTTLGALNDPKGMQSICPVLHGGRILALVAKLNPAKPERGFMSPGDTWAPVAMPSSIPGPMGVLICLDFLYRDSPLHQELVTSRLEECRFLAVPSLTPTHTLNEFTGKSWEEARRYGKPVLYCNHAAAGGTSAYVDEKSDASASAFPEQVGRLEPGDEGMIVADIDLGFDPAGESTRYDEPRVVLPFAAATLVYRARAMEDAYAQWLEKLSGLTEQSEDDRDFATLDQIALHVTGSEPLLRGSTHGGARKSRLLRLIAEAPKTGNIERIRQLTREVVLSDNVLPLPALRSAMALGAADVVRGWLDHLKFDAHEFGVVATKLHRTGQDVTREKLDGWTEGGKRALAAVAAAVRGDTLPSKERESAAIVVATYSEVAEKGFEEAHQKAQTQFRKGQFEEARTSFQAMLDDSLKILSKDPGNTAIQKWAERCRLNVAACTLNLQELQAAQALLRQVDPAILSPEGRLTLAAMFAQTGDITRARSLLSEDDTELPDKAKQKLAEVRQIVSIREGELPVELEQSDSVYVEAAQLLLERDDLESAASYASAGLALAADHPLTRAYTLTLLVNALDRSVFEQPPSAKVIPAEQRADVIEKIEQGFAGLTAEALPRAIAHNWAESRKHYYKLIRDDDRLSHLQEKDGLPRSTEVDPPELQAGERAEQLAGQGKLEEALKILPTEPHPWQDRYNRAQLMAVAGQWETSLTAILDILRQASGMAPVEYFAADLLLRVGRTDEALTHAMAAFTALPGRGYRLLLGRCLLAAGNADDAWKHLRDFDQSHRPEVLAVLAEAAEIAELSEAPRLWRRYLEERPEDGAAQVRLAQTLFNLHHLEEAAKIAWDAFLHHGEELAAEAIYRCALFQRVKGDLSEEVKSRSLEAAAVLRRRFPGDALAESLRLRLMLSTGFEAEADPIDYVVLEQAGFLKSASIGETIQRLQQAHDRNRSIYDFYRAGNLPFVRFCHLTGSRLAESLVRFSRAASTASDLLCTPISIADLPVLSLDGAEILVSNLELSLLQHFDVLPRLRAALGKTGKLMVFGETYSRIIADAAALRERNPRDAWKKQVELADIIARLPRFPEPLDREKDADDDVARAQRLGLPLVHHEETPTGVQRISPHALAKHLFELGAIDHPQLNELELHLPPEPEPPPALPTPFPERFGITTLALQRFFDTGALPFLLRMYPGQVLIGREAESDVQAQKDALDEAVAAAELAAGVHEAVGTGIQCGWIRIVQEPRNLSPLPPFREPQDPLDQEFIGAPLREALAYRNAMEEQPTRRRLIADFFGGVALGSPDTIQRFAWRDPEEYLKLSALNRGMAERDIYLPALIRQIIPPVQADSTLLRLADLGFSDALSSSEILRLERRFRGLAGIVPTRLLDKSEWMAREPGHLGGDLARMRQSAVYAEVIWSAFCEEDDSALDSAAAEALTGVLLRRFEAIDEATNTAALEHLLSFLALRTAERLRASLVRAGPGHHIVSEESRAGKLCGFLSDWAGKDGQRRVAYGRAIREVWCLLDEIRPNGPQEVEFAPLMLARGIKPSRGGITTLEDPEIESVAILSSGWKERPLAKVGLKVTDPTNGQDGVFLFEDALAYGASILGSSEEIEGTDTVLSYPFPIPDLDTPVTVDAPVEAVLLRAPSEAMRAIAGTWARLQGPNDGRAYELLKKIAAAPDEMSARRQYARLTTTALWRLVREDPSFLGIWPHRRGLAGGARLPRIDDLRAILSEPQDPLPVDRSLGTILVERVEAGGAWADRDDARTLYVRASEVPGSLSAAPLGMRLADDVYESEVATALLRLQQPDEHPAARLAGDLIFLRVAAAKKPAVRLPQGEVDLREQLPERILRLLNSMTSGPTSQARISPEGTLIPSIGIARPQTMASSESALLRVCGQVVARLSAHSGRLPLRDDLWLTYRLFQWLCAQLEVLPPDARRAGMIKLVEKAPSNAANAVDLLNPFRFDADRFDHRLASVLYALAAMEEAVVYARKEEVPPLDPPRSVSSAQIEEALAKIAERPAPAEEPTSVLDWHAVGQVPDLALVALMRLNPEGFFLLSSAARLRRIEALPREPGSESKPRQYFTGMVVRVAADYADRLTPEERAAFENALRAMVESPISVRLRWIGLTCLFGPSAPHLESDARSLLLVHVDDKEAPVLYGRFLLSLAAIDPGRIEAEIEQLLVTTASPDKIPDPGPGIVAAGLGRVAMRGSPAGRSAAREILGRLVAREPFHEDPNMKELLGFLGILEHAS